MDGSEEKRDRFSKKRGFCFSVFALVSPNSNFNFNFDLYTTVMAASRKRKLDSVQEDKDPKRVKLASTSVPSAQVLSTPVTSALESTDAQPAGNTDSKTSENVNVTTEKTRPRINKLVPPRPFPTVPTSVSATGPRSSHREGKNMICLTRKTSLSHYMRRCKNVIIVDGYACSDARRVPFV